METELIESQVLDHNETHEMCLIECAKKMLTGDGSEISKAAIELREKFDMLNGFTPKENVTATAHDCIKGLVVGFVGVNSCQWQMAAAANRLQELGYDNVLNHVCELCSRSYSTVSAWMRTERRVAGDKRFQLPFTTYNEIVNARYSPNSEENKAIMEGLLDKAIEEKMDSIEARHMVQDKKGVKQKDIDPSVKDRYLWIEHLGDAECDGQQKLILHIHNQPPDRETVYVFGCIDLKKKCYLTAEGEWKEIERR